MDFVAIDFETANAKRTSACSIGITIVENNKIIKSEEYFIKPYPFYFNNINTSIHGISEKDVINAPTFDKLWEKLLPLIENKVIVAHNASFDVSVLTYMFDHYDIPYPNAEVLCTYRISQFLYPNLPCYRLDFLSNCFDIPICHHNACSDSIACANLMIKFIKNYNIKSWEQIQEKFGVNFGKIYKRFYIPCRHYDYTPHFTAKAVAKNFENIESTYSDDDFKDKCFVFTGTLKSMPRSLAMEIVAKGGGFPKDTVTKKTDYLVVGFQDLRIVKDGNSSKMKRAAELKSKGSGIEVIGEEQFINMIDEELFNLVKN